MALAAPPPRQTPAPPQNPTRTTSHEGRPLALHPLVSPGRPYPLKRIPAMIRGAIERQGKVRFDRSRFQAGDHALTLETVYYVLSSDYKQYMDIQQAINLAIHEAFEAEGIEFAYPSQTLLLRR